MSAAAEARQSELDQVLDAQAASPELAAELFAVADLLTGQPSLRNAMADPTVTDEQRRALATSVFGAKLSPEAATVVTTAVGLRWGSVSDLVAAIDRQGVRSLFSHALAKGTLDAVEDELFKFVRTVVGDQALREALDNRTLPGASRATVVAQLLTGKANDDTVALACRAVSQAKVSFENTAGRYLEMAAAIRHRAVATVTVARPLSAAQAARLQAAITGQVGRPVTLQIVIDQSVLGGARVQVGDEVIEGTVAARLAAAEKQLTQK